MTFQLNFNFTDQDLKHIYETNSNVAIAKPVGGGKPSVAWLILKPFQNNTLEFKEELGIYVSNTEVQTGAKITMLSSTPIPSAQNKLYTLEDNGTISGPSNGGSPNSYALQNNFSNNPYMTVGLYQNAVVNGQVINNNPISGNSVLFRSTITMEPANSLYLWIESNLQTATIVNNVTSPMTKIDFSGGETQISLKYDATSGTFIPIS
ncbi:hypothetical protein DS884_02660 [Tenacibaculum sp. E3R01]|uniref:hypothetical protein n=1 Tax=Tenacibaculum sp. E3R01 TaxID=2267227 RepID=UPI000DE8C98A|nr:hypothetical protein [Tenacibaculum sp. E3R01]RBW61926.1 hypothetical protein DS884_02660 [Tenacibaculum sp. E3R01]